jgi:DNA modification methylase
MTVTPLPAPAGPGRPARARKPTATARFGSSRRESHDATAFYERFVPPDLSVDSTVRRLEAKKLDRIHQADARDMKEVESSSIALVVTSPPYFAGKEYEESLGHKGVPATYFEFLDLLEDVFRECKRVLEPGGRIAVNVANLGRRPYRSLAGDVTRILEDLGLLMRGEVVWWKGKAAGGSCAWGTFQKPSNPVLRDVTERVVIASKGRFDRAINPEQRRSLALPCEATISRDEFLEATTDLWEIAPESASRVGHPAPFPVALPGRLIELYTYEDDVVLDPFMGSGTSAVAAIRTGRHYVGYDTDSSYVRRARARCAQEKRARATGSTKNQDKTPTRSRTPRANSATPVEVAGRDGEDRLERGLREGRQAKELAGILLELCGFSDVRSDVKVPGTGIELDFTAEDQRGTTWAFDVWGAFTTNRTGLRRSEVLWKALGRAAVLYASDARMPLVLLTTDAPARPSSGSTALKAVTGTGLPVRDVVELLSRADHARLRDHALRGGSGS